MTRYILPSRSVEQLAAKVRAAFEEVSGQASPAGSTDGETLIDVNLKAPRARRASLSLRIGEELVIFREKIARGPSSTFEAVLPLGGAGPIELRLVLDGRTYNLTAPLGALGGRHALAIEQWAEGAPPRVRFDESEINRGPGLRFRQVADLPEHDDRRYSVFLIEGGRSLLDIPEPVDIYIDDRRVDSLSPFVVGMTVPVRHHAKLPLGLHRVVIVSRRRGWVLVDTDIVVDGVDEVRIFWSKPWLSSAGIRILTGANEAFSGFRDQLGFRDTMGRIEYRLDSIVVDGVELPEGLDPFVDEIRKDRRFSEAMVANFRAFLAAKQTVEEKKKRGDPLTDEDRAIDAIDTYAKMDEWVSRRKRAEGMKPQETGKTGPDGKMEDITPPAVTPYDEFQKKVTLEVHEPSHARGNQRRAREVGLDWAKLQAYFAALARLRAELHAGKSDAEAAASLTREERDALAWGARNRDKIEAYLRRVDDPVEGAEEEIQEYEAEIKFYDEVLRALQEKRDREANPPVPERFLSLSVRYLHAIRESFGQLSGREKEEMRSRLRALKAQVRDSTTLTDSEKADLTRKLDEALGALN